MIRLRWVGFGLVSVSAAGALSTCKSSYKVDLAGYCAQTPTDPVCAGATPAPAALSCSPGTQPDPATGVFVAPGGSDTSGDGTREHPYATVAKAVTAGKPNVYVAQGTYTVDATIELSASVRLDGGWTTNWQRACGAPQNTVVKAANETLSPVVRTNAAVALTNVTVTTVEQAAGAASPTLVAVHVRGGTLRIEQATLVAGRAGDGKAPAATQAATDPAACNGASDCGQVTPTSTPATPTTEATFTGDGFVPGIGATGDPGTNGKNGSASTSVLKPNSSCVQCKGKPISTAEQNDEYCKAQSYDLVRLEGQPGRCGCGGQGGPGGAGGPGGGASVALLVTGGSASVGPGSTLQTGGGGRGMPGGPGGQGAPGAAGKEGEQVSCFVQDITTVPAKECVYNSSANTCSYSVAPTNLSGKAGSAGEPGSAGKPGEPGPGGPSFGIVTVSGASVQLDPSVTVTPGQGGLGGDGQTRAQSAPQKAY